MPIIGTAAAIHVPAGGGGALGGAKVYLSADTLQLSGAGGWSFPHTEYDDAGYVTTYGATGQSGGLNSSATVFALPADGRYRIVWSGVLKGGTSGMLYPLDISDTNGGTAINGTQSETDCLGQTGSSPYPTPAFVAEWVGNMTKATNVLASVWSSFAAATMTAQSWMAIERLK